MFSPMQVALELEQNQGTWPHTRWLFLENNNMKWLMLGAIKIYWAVIPGYKRRSCLFRVSCSQHVYSTTRTQGWLRGVQALNFRFHNCRGGFHLFNHPIDNSINMLLPQGQIIGENEIAEKFLSTFTQQRN